MFIVLTTWTGIAPPAGRQQPFRIYDTGRVVTVDSQPFTVEFEVVATRVVTNGDPGDVVVPIGGPPGLVDGLAP